MPQSFAVDLNGNIYVAGGGSSLSNPEGSVAFRIDTVTTVPGLQMMGLSALSILVAATGYCRSKAFGRARLNCADRRN